MRYLLPNSILFPHKIKIFPSGPASGNKETLIEMVKSGMRIARLNFSHGDHTTHGKTVQLLKDVQKETQIPFAIALDTKGPEIRTGMIKGDGKICKIQSGTKVQICNDKTKFKECSPEFIYIDYPSVQSIPVGQSLFIDDGLLQFKVEKKVDDKTIECKAMNDGDLGCQKGVNLPNFNSGLPAMTEKDKSDLKFGVEQGVDMIFASFIRSKAHVVEMKAYLKECGDSTNAIAIIPKIENHEGLEK